MLVDAHCHLDLYPSYHEILGDAHNAGVRVLAVTTTPHAYEGNLKRASGHSNVQVALGLHPQIVGTPHADLSLFRKLLPTVAYVGEVGLDASPQYFRTFEEQKTIFRAIVEASVAAGGRPMTIHGIRAFSQVLGILVEHDPNRLNTYALHWFTGSQTEAKRAVEFDCFFSVNEAMFRSVRSRQILTMLPQSQIITETDGPFGKRGDVALRPSMVASVIELLASLWGITILSAQEQVANNFERFISNCQTLPKHRTPSSMSTSER
jgi:TatD DNase family protein